MASYVCLEISKPRDLVLKLSDWFLTLKRECLYFNETFIIGCLKSCQNVNFQWLKLRQNNIFASVKSNLIEIRSYWHPISRLRGLARFCDKGWTPGGEQRGLGNNNWKPGGHHAIIWTWRCSINWTLKPSNVTVYKFKIRDIDIKITYVKFWKNKQIKRSRNQWVKSDN